MGSQARDSERKLWKLREFIFPFFLLPPLWPPSLASCSSTEEYPPPPTTMATLPTGTQTDQPQEMLTRSSSWVATHLPSPATKPWTEASWDLVLVPWEPLFLVPPSKVPSMEANRSRASTPVEGGKGKPTLEEAPPLQELELEDKTSTGRSGSSCPPARAAPATVAGGGGKHLERMSLEQGSLAVSLVAPLTVAAAVTTASLLITTVSTATSRTREDSTTRALTRTRVSTTRTTESANATTA